MIRAAPEPTMSSPTNDDIEKFMQRLAAITTVAHVQDIARAEQAFFAGAWETHGQRLSATQSMEWLKGTGPLQLPAPL
jgi:hypothetical protein